MRLNPHLHVVFLDGAYHEDGTELVWNELGHLRSQKSLRRRTMTPLRNASVAAVDRGPSSCAAHLRSMSSSAQLARGG
ncbi:transposase [Sorangium sp. So ce381]|uniref:transposase n=1 Tax=Sorangium sp. So ce381 TaxID=3133307 RepID=UPI003F5C58BD